MSAYRGGADEDEENGMGWGGLVPSASERRAEKRQERIEREASAGRHIAARLDALMTRCREDGHQLSYADLLELRVSA
jgi:hypothetical protein